MPAICAVAECKNTARLKATIPTLGFHRFPSGDKKLCKTWIQFCKRKDNFCSRTSYICSDHFEKEAYQKDLKNELMGLPPRKMLKTGSVPTNYHGNVISDVSRSERVATRRRKTIVKELLRTTEEPPYKTQCTQTDEITGSDNFEGSCSCPVNAFASQVHIVETELKKKKLRVRVLTNQNRRLRERLQKERNLRRDAVASNSRLRQILSPTQLKKIRKPSRIHWTTEDIVKALTVRSTSLSAYETARVSWKLPLPSTRTLRRWTKRFACKPGVLSDVIEIMKSEASNIPLSNRICVLTFDEMNVNSRIVIDKSTNQIGSSSKVQVVLAKGICDHWKQPIFYEFDQAMRAENLKSLIAEMEKAGYPVHGVCCDLGAENRSVWNSLGIEIEKSGFVNPHDSTRLVHVFADVPHMLKLIRNHILDDGLQLPSGCKISRETFMDLVKYDDSAVKRCPKLSPRLLDVSGPERMRVRPAAQLLSHHVATLAREVFPNCQEISTFIECINNGFDVMNSRVPIEKNKLKSGLGMDIDNQVSALHNLQSLLESIKFFTKRGNVKQAMLPCQRGWIISIRSTLALYEDLKRIYGLKYVLTSRLNQDALESLFSRIRAFGGPNANPTPPEFKYRLRLLLLGSKVRCPSGTNTDGDFQNCDWISTKLLQKNYLRTNSQPDVLEATSQQDKENQNPNKDALQYLAGYLAFKLKRRGHDLGTPTKGKGNTWTHMLSRGGLILPNDEFCEVIKSLNNIFEAHCDLIKKETGYNILLKQMTSELPHITNDIIKEFLSVRLKIEVKYLNSSAGKRLASTRRKLKQFAHGCKQNI